MTTTAASIEQKLTDFETRVTEKLKAHEDRVTQTIQGAGNLGPVGTRSNSDEQRLLSSFGVSHVKQLLDVNIAHPRFAHVDRRFKQAALQLKHDIDCARFTQQIFYGAPRDPEIGENMTLPAVKGLLENRFAKTVDLRNRLKAFSSTTAGDGDEWVPTVLSSNYIEEYELEKKVWGLFKEQPMASNPYELPVQTDLTEARIISEGAAATDTNFGTEKIQFNAKKLVEYYILPEELNEDSAPSVLELGRREVIESQLRAGENLILNGDDSATHMDNAVVPGYVPAGSARRLAKGLRKLALAASSTIDFAGGGVTKTNLDLMAKLANKFGINPKMVGYIMSPSGYNQALAIDEVATAEKFGNQATIITGALSAFRGRPIIVSEYIPDNLNDAGVYDGITTNRTVVVLVNFSRFMIGRRRPIRVTAKKDERPEYDRWQLVSYQRVDFKGHKQAGETYASGTTSTERSVILGIDILA